MSLNRSFSWASWADLSQPILSTRAIRPSAPQVGLVRLGQALGMNTPHKHNCQHEAPLPNQQEHENLFWVPTKNRVVGAFFKRWWVLGPPAPKLRNGIENGSRSQKAFCWSSFAHGPWKYNQRVLLGVHLLLSSLWWSFFKISTVHL